MTESIEQGVGSIKLEKTDESDKEVSATVLRNPEDFSVVHPLAYKWTLWYIKPSSPGVEWKDLMKEVVTFSTVEEFWGVFNNIPRFSALPQKADYAIFKTGVMPEWEDENNAQGGKLSFQSRSNVDIDDRWLKLVLAAIGGTLDVGESQANEQLMGMFANVRKPSHRISVWTKTCDVVGLLPLAQNTSKVLELETGELEFNSHDRSKSKFKI